MQTLIRRQLLAAVVAAVAVSPAIARAQTRPSAADVLARAAKATDPSAKLAGYKSVRSTSDVEVLGVGITGKVEIYAARPDRFLTQTTLGPIGTVSAGHDGSVGWMINPAMGPSLMDSSQMSRARHLNAFDAMLIKAESFKSMSEPVVETFEGRPCYKLHLVAATSFEYDAYFDVESGLRRGLKYEDRGPMGMVPVTMILDDYREFGGIMVAAKVTQRTPTLSLVQRTLSMQFDTVADSMFALPPAIKTLAGK
jgi:hypothetical protein